MSTQSLTGGIRLRCVNRNVSSILYHDDDGLLSTHEIMPASFTKLKNDEDAKRNKKIREDYIDLIEIILEHSTSMPFRWFSNKYMCFYCCRAFINSSALKEHTTEEHGGVRLKSILRHLVCSNGRLKLDVSKMSCKICPKKICSLDEFLAHAKDAHDLAFNMDSRKQIFTFMLSDDKINCLECDETFTFFGQLLIHVYKFHNRSERYVCEKCGQVFAGKPQVQHHIEIAHTNMKYYCSQCSKKFVTIKDLQTHKTKKHANTKCPKCLLVFPSRYLRRKHLLVDHAIVNDDLICDICSKAFPVKSLMLQHKLKKHIKEKEVQCSFCGYKCYLKNELNRHMVSHGDSRPFECEFCKKTFPRKKTLNIHRRIHTNDRRHKCKECEKAFVQVTSLKLHVRVHHSSN